MDKQGNNSEKPTGLKKGILIKRAPEPPSEESISRPTLTIPVQQNVVLRQDKSEINYIVKSRSGSKLKLSKVVVLQSQTTAIQIETRSSTTEQITYVNPDAPSTSGGTTSSLPREKNLDALSTSRDTTSSLPQGKNLDAPSTSRGTTSSLPQGKDLDAPSTSRGTTSSLPRGKRASSSYGQTTFSSAPYAPNIVPRTRQYYDLVWKYLLHYCAYEFRLIKLGEELAAQTRAHKLAKQLYKKNKK